MSLKIEKLILGVLKLPAFSFLLPGLTPRVHRTTTSDSFLRDRVELPKTTEFKTENVSQFLFCDYLSDSRVREADYFPTFKMSVTYSTVDAEISRFLI